MMNEKVEDAVEPEKEPAGVTFKEFLESCPPSTETEVTELWEKRFISHMGDEPTVNMPDLRLHCRICEGVRTFRSTEKSQYVPGDPPTGSLYLSYVCGDCRQQQKRYSIWVALSASDSGGRVFKYDELPSFGVPVPNAVLRLFGKEASLFMKGRQCENLGFGVAAFAYYRRVVENHKNEIFDAIIKVCQTLNIDQELVAELQAAKAEISFQKSVEHIKAGIPQGLLINGHSPLEALHSALSVGLHSEDDKDCLEAASAVRLVLADLTEKIATLRQENKELLNAVQLLLSKKTKASGIGSSTE